jgi:hypothetical protein
VSGCQPCPLPASGAGFGRGPVAATCLRCPWLGNRGPEKRHVEVGDDDVVVPRRQGQVTACASWTGVRQHATVAVDRVARRWPISRKPGSCVALNTIGRFEDRARGVSLSPRRHSERAAGLCGTPASRLGRMRCGTSGVASRARPGAAAPVEEVMHLVLSRRGGGLSRDWRFVA